MSDEQTKKPRRPSLYVVSDATGNTAEKTVRAALLQFQHDNTRLRIWPSIRTFEEVEQVVDNAIRHEALIVHTLVNTRLRQHLYALALERGVESVDLIGALLAKLGSFLHAEPDGTPGAKTRLDDEYFRRIEAMEFSVQNDDGRNSKNMLKADIVLVGVSRTSKTPVSTHLAAKGYRVANVPLVYGVEPPEALFSLPPGRVFALTIDPKKLQTIREARIAQIGGVSKKITSKTAAGGGYADHDTVFKEVRWALDMFRQRTDWPVIDVTSRAVEETAAEVLKRKAQIEEELTE